jgi:hypothetical protein
MSWERENVLRTNNVDINNNADLSLGIGRDAGILSGVFFQNVSKM